MGIFKQLYQTVKENAGKSKEEREAEKSFIRENAGTKAICAFIAHLFEKGEAGYKWVKENHTGLFPVINEDSVSLCYTQPGDGQSFSGMKPRDVETVRYDFQEMYKWFGLKDGEGYTKLLSVTQKNELERLINLEVEKLNHIKYNNGFVVKMFH